MKWYSLVSIAALVLLAPPEAGAQDSAEKTLEAFVRIAGDEVARVAMISESCRAEWQSDFAMQAYCREQQTEGFVSLITLWNERVADNDDLAPAGAKCILDWEENGSFDYTMIDYCLDQQVKAYDSLR